ncbi:MAG: Sec-independent protein translocase protein TatB [Kiloniellales bacterium]
MFDIGWSEMTVVVVIALLVLGPKQLPEALKTVTQLTRKARRYAQDFRSGIDNIVREAELEDAREALSSVKSANPSKVLSDLVDPTGEVDEEMRDLADTAKKSAAKVEAKPSAASDVKKEAETDEAGAKVVKAPEAIAPSNSIRPPPGPDMFASAAPREPSSDEAADKPDPVPAAAPESPPQAKAEEAAKAAAPPAQSETASDDTKEDSKVDERRQA